MSMMQKAVLDTNIIISAAITDNGNPAKIIQMVFDEEIGVYYDELIFSEYIKVISRPKFKFSQELQDTFINGLKQARIFPMPVTLASNIPFIDESDRKFYDVAKSCGVNLITGNNRHYPDESFIITPSQFLQSLDR
jgi:putative PIN family toxin of toxin-antitoxin system